MGLEFKVEDGSGVSGANSYIAAEDVDALMVAVSGSVNAAWAAKDTPTKQGICRFLSRWIDNYMRGKLPGVVSTAERDRLLFPQEGAYDAEGRKIEGVPHEIPELIVDLIPYHLTKPLENAPARGGAIESVKAGGVEVKWRADAAADRDFGFVAERLSSILGLTESDTQVELTKDF